MSIFCKKSPFKWWSFHDWAIMDVISRSYLIREQFDIGKRGYTKCYDKYLEDKVCINCGERKNEIEIERNKIKEKYNEIKDKL